MNRINNVIDKLDHDVREIPVKYVSKEDYKSDIREIKDMLRGIYDKIDSKQDKVR